MDYVKGTESKRYINSVAISERQAREFKEVIGDITPEQCEYIAKICCRELGNQKTAQIELLGKYLRHLAGGVVTVPENKAVVPPQTVNEGELTAIERFLVAASKGKEISENIIQDAVVELKMFHLHRATEARLEMQMKNINNINAQRMFVIGDIEAIYNSVKGKREETRHEHGAII